MRYFEAKVLVPLGVDIAKVTGWETFLAQGYDGFHKGVPVHGNTPKWGPEQMAPYYVAFEESPGRHLEDVVKALKHAVVYYFDQETVYIAVTELAAPFIH